MIVHLSNEKNIVAFIVFLGIIGIASRSEFKMKEEGKCLLLSIHWIEN